MNGNWLQISELFLIKNPSKVHVASSFLQKWNHRKLLVMHVSTPPDTFILFLDPFSHTLDILAKLQLQVHLMDKSVNQYPLLK